MQRDMPDLIHSQGQRVSRVLLIFLMTISQTMIAKDLILRLLECKSTFNGPGYLCFRGNTLGKPGFPGSMQFTLQTGRQEVQMRHEASCLPR